MSDIVGWWPQLDEQIRRALVNGIWMPVSEFARNEIERLGGPDADGDFWKLQDGDHYLPHEAVQWIVKAPDFESFLEVRKPDPRAAYFRRGWPRRQP